MIHRGNFDIVDLGWGIHAHWTPGTNIEIRERKLKLCKSYEVWNYSASDGNPAGGTRISGPYNTWDEAVLAWSMLK